MTLAPHLPAPHLKARRQALLDRLDGAAVLVVSGRAPRRSNTIHHAFKPDSDFFYLTGFAEPDAALLLIPGRESVAFVRPRDLLAETWNGRRLGVEAAPERLGVDLAYPSSELAERLPALLAGVDRLCCPMGRYAELDTLLMSLFERYRANGPTVMIHPRPTLHELRARKDAHEIEAMRRAAAATLVGFTAAARAMRPGGNEHDLRAALEAGFLMAGARAPAYNTIAGTGANATILHYTENDAPLEDGQLVLLDAGAEVGWYACDVTRTYPVSGRFTPLQRQVYEIVLDAQVKAIDALRVGAVANAYHAVANRVLTEGLVRLGVLSGDVDELLASKAHKPYTLHDAGHFLGLDTHDVGAMEQPLEPGMVLTVEPGLYFPVDDEAIAPELRGLGIRIEDDVLVTPEGPDTLTAALPKEPAAVEAWLLGLG